MPQRVPYKLATPKSHIIVPPARMKKPSIKRLSKRQLAVICPHPSRCLADTFVGLAICSAAASDVIPVTVRSTCSLDVEHISCNASLPTAGIIPPACYAHASTHPAAPRAAAMMRVLPQTVADAAGPSGHWCGMYILQSQCCQHALLWHGAAIVAFAAASCHLPSSAGCVANL